jgi:signal transduction histidine kinase
VNLSVRARLTAAVALIVGALALAAALVAPPLIEEALVSDSLAAEAESSAAIIADPELPDDLPDDLPEVLDPDMLDPDMLDLDVFGSGGFDLGPFVPDITSTDAFGELLRQSGGGDVVVVIGDDLAAFVRPDGSSSLEAVDVAALDRPVVALEEYLEISVESGSSIILADAFGDAFDTGSSVFDVATVDVPDALTFGVVEVRGVHWLVAAPLDDIRRSVDRVRAVLWWGLPVAMVAAGAIAWLLASRALRPVRSITEQTSRISAGTLHERVPVPATGDEIHALATTMNEMLDRLHRHDERRRRFVSDASHELRSPVAAMRTEAEVALRSGGPIDGRALASGVVAEATRLGEIVDDLLSLARHDEGLPPPAQPIDLDDVVLAEARRPRRVPVDVGAVSAGRVRARRDEMTRIARHLLDNAARHAASAVVVGLASDGRDVTLTVDDDGPGVPADQRAGVFQRFVRLDDARTRDHGGAGLGLAVVATVARSLGGDATVGDAPIGGARFTVTLPVAE